MATKKAQKKAAPKKAVAKSAKKTAITQAVAAGNKAKKETQKRSKAAIKGHETRRANETKKNLHHTKPAKGGSNTRVISQAEHTRVYSHACPTGFIERTLKAEALLYSDTKAPTVDQKSVGTITGISSYNEGLSLKMGANIGSLLQRMRVKLYGSQAPSETNPDKSYSPSAIVGPLERTRDNQESSLKMLEELDTLLETML